MLLIEHSSIDSFQFTLSGQIANAGTVVNAVPGDFNSDGKLDLLIMSESSRNRAALDMQLYLEAPRGFGEPFLLASFQTSELIFILTL